jgi:hypothetical protein
VPSSSGQWATADPCRVGRRGWAICMSPRWRARRGAGGKFDVLLGSQCRGCASGLTDRRAGSLNGSQLCSAVPPSVWHPEHVSEVAVTTSRLQLVGDFVEQPGRQGERQRQKHPFAHILQLPQGTRFETTIAPRGLAINRWVNRDQPITDASDYLMVPRARRGHHAVVSLEVPSRRFLGDEAAT